ncbi:MAG: Nif3-like dinuclear metal center hexameric protein [Planctomycetes bacterium]|nr:Nif3-like dinuclear metal center hexameric protein [Planctomycetota bacterium]
MPKRSGSMIGELALAMEAVAPRRLAASWDNTGFLLGDPSLPLRRALLTIDLTSKVLDEAIASRCEAIVAYHPPIFEPLKQVTAMNPRENLLLRCAVHQIALLSPHTALDAVRGGMADWLADLIGAGERAALEPAGRAAQVLVSTHVPVASVDAVREAMAQAGAGHIGDYSQCSFTVDGRGTFLGGFASHPAVGRRGSLEEVAEAHLTMIASASIQGEVIQAIERSHPYETPAIHVVPLATELDHAQGQGRTLTLNKPNTAGAIARRLRTSLKLPAGTVQICDAKKSRRHERVAIVPGSGASMLPQALAAQCTLMVTGEAKHHDVLLAQDNGCDLVLAGHTNTERGFLPHFAKLLQLHVPAVRLLVSRQDRHPLANI